MGFSGKEGKGAREGAPPSPIRIGKGAAPLSFLPPSSSFPLPLQVGKGEILLPVGVGLLLWARHPPWPAPPPLLYIQGQGGTPKTQQLIS